MLKLESPELAWVESPAAPVELPRELAAAREVPWTLQRRRQVLPPSAADADLIRRLLRLCQVTPTRFVHAGRSTPVRPAVGDLLRCVVESAEMSIPMEAVIRSLLNRPATLRAVRQTTFRANRTLERVGCPIILHCRAMHLVLSIRKWRFDARPAVVAFSDQN
ncbi:MAG: hypothetical protein QM754_00435 [Tepidisphaeraceae bacterium]